MKYYEEEIIAHLKEKFPNDPVIANLNKKEVQRAIREFWNNVLVFLKKGFIVKIQNYMALYVKHSKKLG